METPHYGIDAQEQEQEKDGHVFRKPSVAVDTIEDDRTFDDDDLEIELDDEEDEEDE